MKRMTCGRETSCDLVLEHPAVSRVHAYIELADGGQVSLLDAGSSNGTFLHRNDAWIRIKKVTLCIGDRIRFGDNEVTLEQLTAVFGHRSNARLSPKYFSLRQGKKDTSLFTDWPEPEAPLDSPRRNPVTGRIEEDHQ